MPSEVPEFHGYHCPPGIRLIGGSSSWAKSEGSASVGEACLRLKMWLPSGDSTCCYLASWELSASRLITFQPTVSIW